MKIGIDLGGSHVSIGVVDNNLKIVEKKEIDFISKEKEYIIDCLENKMVQKIKEYIAKYDIQKIGMAIPGNIDKNEKLHCENLPLKDYNIKKALKEHINKEIFFGNDVDCMALAEYKLESINNYKDVVFLTLGTGVGGAVFYQGKILKPKLYSGMEFGHMTIEKDGKLCKCGNKGCYEKYASIRVLKQKIREKIHNEEARGKEIVQYIKNNKTDTKLQNILNEYTENVSIGICNLINIFEPEAICIGGSFVYFADILIPKLKQNILQSKKLYNKRDDIVIKTATLGNDAGIIGSTLL